MRMVNNVWLYICDVSVHDWYALNPMLYNLMDNMRMSLLVTKYGP